MKRNQVPGRTTLAGQLEDWAARLRRDEPIRVGTAAARVPDRVSVETELEKKNGRAELELEIKWPAAAVEAVPLVGVLTRSPSDLETVMVARDTLKSLDVACEVRVLSAHRTPDLTLDFVRSAEARGIEVIVACAGMANHLAGTVAAHTALPVIGVPLASGRLGGLDSLLSTVQMPSGVPVATVSVDGVKNAAFLAVRILALKYPEVRARLDEAMAAERARYEKASHDAEGRVHAGGDAAQPSARSTPTSRRNAPAGRAGRLSRSASR